VTCTLGAIGIGGTATVDIVLRAGASGNVTTSATVASTPADPNLANNTATAVINILPSAVPGDVNGDAVVNCADISIVRTAFGKRTGQAGFDARADVVKDGVIDVRDLAYVSQRLPAGTVCR
jgi:hypothetical protein